MAAVIEIPALAGFRRAVKSASTDLDREFRAALLASVAPIVADAKSRFESLPGTGPRTAQQVSGSATQSRVSVRPTSKGGYEFGREFGSKGPKSSTFTTKGGVRVTRTINYANPHIFGPWKGNQFVLPPGHSGGNAFLPAVAAGAGRAATQAQAVVDAMVNRMATG